MRQDIPMDSLEEQFHRDMCGIYEKAKKRVLLQCLLFPANASRRRWSKHRPTAVSDRPAFGWIHDPVGMWPAGPDRGGAGSSAGLPPSFHGGRPWNCPRPAAGIWIPISPGIDLYGKINQRQPGSRNTLRRTGRSTLDPVPGIIPLLRPANDPG